MQLPEEWRVNPLLRVEGVSKRYGGVCALDGVSMEVAPGEVHALIGGNGAGKSTLSKVIAGVVRPDAGRILLDGKPATIRSPLDAQRHGIGIIFQELDLFTSLTVAENVAIRNVHVEKSWLVNSAALDRFCRPFLDQVGFHLPSSTRVEELSIGQMQLVAIARALSMGARLILMDEPTSSLSEDDVDRLFGLIRSLGRNGVSVVYVSHRMQEILRIADRITVLRDGRYVGTRSAADVTPEAIIAMMVGAELAQTVHAASHRTDRVLLTVRNLSSAKLKGISFDVRAGEVLGIAGLVGAGRSELGAALFGLDPTAAGTVSIGGRDNVPPSPREAIARGLGLVPEDRKLQGLMMQMSVKENSTLSILPELAVAGLVDGRQEVSRSAGVLQRMALKAASYDAVVSSLSGGNQQKVLLSRWLLVDPDVLFLDEPTRGIDVSAKEDVYGVIEELARSGKGVILVSSELPELLRCSDRIMVLHEGRVTGMLESSEATQEKIMALATCSAEHANGEPQIAE
jgi:ABC-type sugar transport system ATPase subunit